MRFRTKISDNHKESGTLKALLKFEHIIQVNDPTRPEIPLVSHELLWQGLLLRAMHPEHFNPSLECRLEKSADADNSHDFVRIISVGDLELRDEVTVVPMHEISTLIDGRKQAIHAHSVTRIEEPQQGHLIVRFIYERDSIAEQGGLDADEYLKSAYLESDRDAIIKIREMIRIGGPLRLM